jgi:hypothetical protein
MLKFALMCGLSGMPLAAMPGGVTVAGLALAVPLSAASANPVKLKHTATATIHIKAFFMFRLLLR